MMVRNRKVDQRKSCNKQTKVLSVYFKKVTDMHLCLFNSKISSQISPTNTSTQKKETQE